MLNIATKQKNIIFIYLSIFVLLSLFAFIVLNYEKNKKIENYLDDKTKQYSLSYSATYRAYKKSANTIYDTKINIKEIKEIFKEASIAEGAKKDLVRTKLFNKLKDIYKTLKKYDLKQLHFHLPNNESFLRYHRSKKYGDNLTNIRETVRYVNETKEPIDGFEEGRIYNGYRFVFPLIYEGEHIGSVEVSYSTMTMSLDIMNDFNVMSQFLISKTVVDEKVFDSEKSNYIESMFENFYLEKKIFQEISKYNKTTVETSQKTKDIIKNHIMDGESFSIYESKQKDIMTFIKVKNPISKKVVALFLIRSNDSYISNKTRNFYIMLLLTIILIASVLVLIYKELKYKSQILLINKNLESTVKEEVEKSRLREEYLQMQSRMAQMGEMISMIAHQWRQPLGAISSTSLGLQLKLDLEDFDLEKKKDRQEFLDDFTDSLNAIDGFVQNLTTTMDDFRNFYKPNKELVNIEISEVIEKSLNIIKHSLDSEKIKIFEEYGHKGKIDIYDNEIMQVILNILKNAQDNFKEKEIKDPYIKITTENRKISICDNGGGIKEDILDNIFDSYFSTKSEKIGTGLGLYMSKIIVEEHHNGKLYAENTDDGVCFIIDLGIISEKKKV